MTENQNETETTPVALSIVLQVVPGAGQALEEAAVEMTELFKQYIESPDSTFVADYGASVQQAKEYLADPENAEEPTWGGYQGPWVASSEVTSASATGEPSSSFQSPGASLIAAERMRQVEGEGWTPAEDLRLERGELAAAASGYLASVLSWPLYKEVPPVIFPWPDNDGWKPTGDEVRDLTKAGALIAAQIDRLLAERAPEIVTATTACSSSSTSR